MDDAAKEQLIARLRAYLDSEDSLDAGLGRFDPGPDDGQQPEAAPDLFSLLAELAALKNEVKLESRQVKTALDQFRELCDTLRDSHARVVEEQQQRRQQQRAAAEQGEEKLILELLDLRDRIQAGHNQCRRFRPGWLGRRRAAEFVASMGDGMAMNLRRLDETLARRGVRPLPALDQSFDPHRMHAAELANDPDVAAGVVVAELRMGFLRDGRLLRPAEVVVNRQPTPEPPGDETSLDERPAQREAQE